MSFDRLGLSPEILRAVAQQGYTEPTPVQTQAIPLVLAGWWYARNALHFGTPVVGNWRRLAGQATWWQAPGFHFAGYYLRFGASLWAPFFAGFHSFWDGIYSTLWSDALLGGVARAADRHPQWNYAAMAGVPALSLPATVTSAKDSRAPRW